MIRHCGGFGRNQIGDNLETEAEGCMTPQYLLPPISSLLSQPQGGGALAITVHLSEILKERGMTAKELCALVGITEANLSILRSGKASGVRFHTINRICYYLNCDVGDILRFDGRLEDDHEGT